MWIAVVSARVARAGARTALLVAGLMMAASSSTAGAQRARGLSLEQIRGVMRANAGAFSACLASARKRDNRLHGPFLYQIQVDKRGKVKEAHPYQPSSVASFDRCIVAVIKRAKFPGGPATVETPIVFDAN